MRLMGLCLMMAAGACTAPPAAAPTAVPDAGNAHAGNADAGSDDGDGDDGDSGDSGGAVDAGGSVDADIPTVDVQVDAGHVGDTAPPVGKPVNKTVDRAGINDAFATIYNRVLVKPVDGKLGGEALQRLAVQTAGPVVRVRRTAGTFWLIEFAATTPPRKKAEQQQLVQKLLKTKRFAVVEGDHVMTIK